MLFEHELLSKNASEERNFHCYVIDWIDILFRRQVISQEQ